MSTNEKTMHRHLIAALILFTFTARAQTNSKVLIQVPPAEGGFSATRLMRLDSGMSDWVKKKW
ncbi:MAG TPA: hypothetical protein VK772_08585, partial [Puia sp.]|nr:hypothetical protein [Puia sp.]